MLVTSLKHFKIVMWGLNCSELYVGTLAWAKLSVRCSFNFSNCPACFIFKTPRPLKFSMPSSWIFSSVQFIPKMVVSIKLQIFCFSVWLDLKVIMVMCNLSKLMGLQLLLLAQISLCVIEMFCLRQLFSRAQERNILGLDILLSL